MIHPIYKCEVYGWTICSLFDYMSTIALLIFLNLDTSFFFAFISNTVLLAYMYTYMLYSLDSETLELGACWWHYI